ncbi:MAG TPA: chaperone modulator CbpM [Steroidobacteraceae bacterium]|nr:chaperone modulator CbpM [Steroidobacteraceae bacterium]
MTTVILRGEVLSNELDVDLATLVRCCQLQQEELIDMVDAGLLEPRGEQPSAWRFSGIDLQRARVVQRLIQDLGVNLEGAALILDLLDERAELRSRIRLLSTLVEDRA